MPMCPNCGEKWDLADEYDACPNCGGGGADVKMKRRYQILFWVVAVIVVIGLFAATGLGR